MKFSESVKLLNSRALHLETGIERLTSGGLHVAVRMCLEHCTADMLDWWFGAECDTNMYRLWHPGAHKKSEWGNYAANHVPGNVIGTTHFISETFGGTQVKHLQLKYMDPIECFGTELEKAKQRGDADVVFYGVGGASEPDGTCKLYDTQYIGVGRDTPYGLILRNHYWLGDTLDIPAEEVEKSYPEQIALGLLEHDSNEFHILGRVIPAFYLRDNWECLGAPEPYSKTRPLSKYVTKKLFV